MTSIDAADGHADLKDAKDTEKLESLGCVALRRQRQRHARPASLAPAPGCAPGRIFGECAPSKKRSGAAAAAKDSRHLALICAQI